MLRIIILFIPIFAFSQEVSRTTMSVIGNSTSTSNGYYVTQTVGQLSTIGFFEMNNKSVIAGYQQPMGFKLIDASIEKETLQLYPVPVSNELNLVFSMTLEGSCSFELFDRLGRLVLSQELSIINYTARISLAQYAASTYLIKITNNKSVFYENIIKND